jgi:hypothetical protein
MRCVYVVRCCKANHKSTLELVLGSLDLPPAFVEPQPSATKSMTEL